MSNTPNARKAAARQHQREHGSSYAAALAAVSPEASASASKPSAAVMSDAAAEAIRAVRFFDEATADVVGQSPALGQLRTLLGQHVVAGRGGSGDRVVVDIGAPARGLWEETICIAFAQAWMLGTTGIAPAARVGEPGTGVTWVGTAATYDMTHGGLRRQADEVLGDCPLIVRCRYGPGFRDAAIHLRYLSTRELAFVTLRSLADRAGATLGFSVEDVVEHVRGDRQGTGDEGRDLAGKAVARALIRSEVDEPGSPAEVTVDDVATVFEFMSLAGR